MIERLLSSNWFWALWSIMGAYAMLKIRKKGMPLFGDFATFWFGITAFLIGFTVQFSFLDFLISSSSSLSVKEIIYIIILLLSFFISIRILATYKYLKPFLFVIQMFILGMICNSLLTKLRII